MKPDFREEIAEVVAEYIPSWQLSEWDRAMLCREWLIGELDGDHFTSRFYEHGEALVANHERELELLSEIKVAMEKLIQANARLHPRVRRALNYAFSDNLKKLNAEGFCDERLVALADIPQHGHEGAGADEVTQHPIHLSRPLDTLSEWMTGCLHGKDPTMTYLGGGKPIGVSAIDAAKQALSELEEFRPKEQVNNTWKKVMLVSRCRRIWAEHIGTPPAKPSDTKGRKFFAFVNAMIAAIGERWKTEPTINAWRRAKNRDRNRQIF